MPVPVSWLPLMTESPARVIFSRSIATRERLPLARNAAGGTGSSSKLEYDGRRNRPSRLQLTATHLTELDLPLDWTDQRNLLSN
jgi:hypothetical protein